MYGVFYELCMRNEILIVNFETGMSLNENAFTHLFNNVAMLKGRERLNLKIKILIIFKYV